MTQPTSIPAEIYEQADILCDQFRSIDDDREFVARILMEVGQGAGHPAPLGLTEGQSSALAFVTGYQTAKGFAPSYREIADALGVSKSGVHRLVHGLISRGALSMIPGGARSIAIAQHAAVSAAHNFSGVN